MTIGLLIIAAIILIALATAWHFVTLFEAVKGILVFMRALDQRIHALEVESSWLGGGEEGQDGGGPH